MRAVPYPVPNRYAVCFAQAGRRGEPLLRSRQTQTAVCIQAAAPETWTLRPTQAVPIGEGDEDHQEAGQSRQQVADDERPNVDHTGLRALFLGRSHDHQAQHQRRCQHPLLLTGHCEAQQKTGPERFPGQHGPRRGQEPHSQPWVGECRWREKDCER